MSVATPMYHLPRQVNMPNVVELPECMYKMEPLNRFSSKDLAPSYYGSTCAGAAQIQGTSSDVASLEIRQETVLQRLRDLKLQLDKLQSSKFSTLSPSKSSASIAIGAAAQSSPLKQSVAEKQAIVVKVMAAVTNHLQEIGSLDINSQKEKEIENVIDTADQHRSILCRLSALKAELSKVSELQLHLSPCSKNEGIAEKQKSILKVIIALKEEVYRIAELQERSEQKECSSELDVVSHHKEVLKKLASLQDELVKLLRSLRNLSWEVVHIPCGCLSNACDTSSSHSLSHFSFLESLSPVGNGQDGSWSQIIKLPTTFPSVSAALLNGTVHDLVISSNPNQPPFFLILLRKLLKDVGYPVYSVDHLHSSVHHVDETVRRCFVDKPFGDRSKHNLAFTVQWKDVETPSLMVNPLRQSVISGEANITRYVSRLFPLTSPFNYEATGTFTSIAETDNLLDQLAAQASSRNNKERQSALRQLNGRLGKKSWLVGDDCGIADVLLWSTLKQGGLNVGAPPNVDKWYKKVDVMANLESRLSRVEQGKQTMDNSTTIKASELEHVESLVPSEKEFVNRHGLESYLKSLNINYQVQDHMEVFTVEELMKCVERMPGLHMKNLFLKDKKKNLYLLAAQHNAEIKLNDVGKQLGIKDLRFGDETTLFDTLGVKQGCVTVYALLNDKCQQVKLILDAEAFNEKHPFINFHPITNAATLGVSPKDLKKFLNVTRHEPTLLSFK